MDSGNIAWFDNKVMVTLNIFTENKEWKEQNFIKDIDTQLGYKQVIVIPK